MPFWIAYSAGKYSEQRSWKYFVKLVISQFRESATNYKDFYCVTQELVYRKLQFLLSFFIGFCIIIFCLKDDVDVRCILSN